MAEDTSRRKFLKAAALTAATVAAAGAATATVAASKGQNAAHLVQTFGANQSQLSGANCTTLYQGGKLLTWDGVSGDTLILESNDGITRWATDTGDFGIVVSSGSTYFYPLLGTIHDLGVQDSTYYESLNCNTLYGLGYVAGTSIKNPQTNQVFGVLTADNYYAKCFVLTLETVGSVVLATVVWTTYQ